MITFNGTSSDSIGVIVERMPARYIPTRRFSAAEVAGRNGDVLIADASFPNVIQEYEVYLSAESSGLPSVARACAEWLCAPTDYARLTDSYDTSVYRMAYLSESFDIENVLNKFGRATIAFSCKPQKFLTSGESAVSVTSGDSLTNPTPFYARPLITVSGSGAITFNGKTINVLETVTSFKIDCQSMNADDNTKIYCLDFPYFIGGENEITLGEDITSCSIVPRWWTL